MKKDKIIVIADANHVFHRAYNKFGNLSFQGKGTGGIFGTLNITSSILKELKPDKFYFVWDGGRHKSRLAILPEYKGSRKQRTPQERKEFSRQQIATRQCLKSLGVCQVLNSEMEADDYIGWLARRYDREGYQVIIVSSDKDFHQCITERVLVWDDRSKEFLTKDNLKEKKNYHPHQVADYLCLVGDDGDNIKGFPGIGPVKAIKFLDDHGSIMKYIIDAHIAGDLKTNANFRIQLVDVYTKNRPLINLEYFYIKYLHKKVKLTYYKDKKYPPISKSKFFTLCEKHGLRSLKTRQTIELYSMLKERIKESLQ